ncbi:hypothetical protein D7X55_29375 [Corallococcus sp. AB049A]|uniref:hypothetical protein n=1 Tax=Corallococcus sp. AB049A TaxID=2316721 RepID=UPI000ED65E89|nr:hypothetical protein [Corallococcus sp. AB049A]RKI55432.1 hypothetical protein D7X55_29375 [Corallococcus sp. AB049A]
MKRQALAVALSLFATACGGAMEESSTLATQESALLSLTGTWCQTSWPGCAVFGGSTVTLSSGGDGCWLVGDTKFTGLTAGTTPGIYTGTRHMYGTGTCPGHPAPRSVTITMTDDDHFTEVAGDFTANWYRLH